MNLTLVLLILFFINIHSDYSEVVDLLMSALCYRDLDMKATSVTLKPYNYAWGPNHTGEIPCGYAKTLENNGL